MKTIEQIRTELHDNQQKSLQLHQRLCELQTVSENDFDTFRATLSGFHQGKAPASDVDAAFTKSNTLISKSFSEILSNMDSQIENLQQRKALIIDLGLSSGIHLEGQ